MRSLLRIILALLLVGRTINGYLSVVSILHSGNNLDISLYSTLFRHLVISIGLVFLYFFIWMITKRTKVTSFQESIPEYFLVFSAALMYTAATFYHIKLSDFLTFTQHFHQAILVEALFLMLILAGIISDRADSSP